MLAQGRFQIDRACGGEHRFGRDDRRLPLGRGIEAVAPAGAMLAQALVQQGVERRLLGMGRLQGERRRTGAKAGRQELTT